MKGVAELAKKMQVSQESLYKSFNGQREPKFKTINKFLQAIGIKVKFADMKNVK